MKCNFPFCNHKKHKNIKKNSIEYYMKLLEFRMTLVCSCGITLNNGNTAQDFLKHIKHNEKSN